MLSFSELERINEDAQIQIQIMLRDIKNLKKIGHEHLIDYYIDRIKVYLQIIEKTNPPKYTICNHCSIRHYQKRKRLFWKYTKTQNAA